MGAMSLPPLPVALHMGALHPYEQVLTVVLAFGPFAVLGLVIWRRRGEPDEPDEHGAPGVPDEPGESGETAPGEIDRQRER